MKSFSGSGPTHELLFQRLLTTVFLSICGEPETILTKRFSLHVCGRWKVVWHLWESRLSLSRLLLCAVTQAHVWKAHCTLSLSHQFWIAKHYYCYRSNYFKSKKKSQTWMKHFGLLSVDFNSCLFLASYFPFLLFYVLYVVPCKTKFISDFKVILSVILW